MDYLPSRTTLAIFTLLVAGSSYVLTPQKCRILPSDATWPAPGVWDAFNASVDGRLIHTTPIAAACHHPNFDAEKCNEVQANWHSPAYHEKSSSSIQTPLFANKSCDPFTGPNSPCVTGKHVEYAVDVSTPSHVIATVEFAKKHNIRFVVRNTGHDYMGKSTGSGGLAVWMGHLKETEWIKDYRSSKYEGPAVKMQAGVSVVQMYEEASSRGYVLISGACPTVGLAGGYLQGGGHGPFGSRYGLGADQILSMEVITTRGQFLTASPAENSDLFWAISGGGGGTYGILWSVTVKVFPDTPVTGALLSFSTGPKVSLSTWWEAVHFYQASTPTYTDAGATVFAFYSTGTFTMSLFLPNGTFKDVSKLLRPFVPKLDLLSVPHTLKVETFPSFLPAYYGLFPAELFGIGLFFFGGRLLPRKLWESEDGIDKVASTIRRILEDGGAAFDISIRATLDAAGHPYNSVNPAWRTAERAFVPTLLWDDHADWPAIVEKTNKITHVYNQALRELAPDSGAYLNEADPFEPNWQEAFYGSNYAKLLAIKDKWDPDQLLYGATAVGGDRWFEQEDGRLCPAPWRWLSLVYKPFVWLGLF